MSKPLLSYQYDLIHHDSPSVLDDYLFSHPHSSIGEAEPTSLKTMADIMHDTNLSSYNSNVNNNIIDLNDAHLHNFGGGDLNDRDWTNYYTINDRAQLEWENEQRYPNAPTHVVDRIPDSNLSGKRQAKSRKRARVSPKRPHKAYVLYLRSAREAFFKEHPESSYNEFQKVIARQWKNLGTEEKRPWVDMELQEQRKYEAYLAETGTMPRNNCAELDSSGEEMDVGDNTPITPITPRNTKNGFALYCKVMSAGLMSANPGVGINQVQVMLAAKWKAMSNDDKKSWMNRHGSKWREFPTSKDSKRKMAALPRGPRSAYVLFYHQCRRNAATDSAAAHLAPVDYPKDFFRRWKSLPPEEQARWFEKAVEDKDRYTKEMAVLSRRPVVNGGKDAVEDDEDGEMDMDDNASVNYDSLPSASPMTGSAVSDRVYFVAPPLPPMSPPPGDSSDHYDSSSMLLREQSERDSQDLPFDRAPEGKLSNPSGYSVDSYGVASHNGFGDASPIIKIEELIVGRDAMAASRSSAFSSSLVQHVDAGRGRQPVMGLILSESSQNMLERRHGSDNSLQRQLQCSGGRVQDHSRDVSHEAGSFQDDSHLQNMTPSSVMFSAVSDSHDVLAPSTTFPAYDPSGEYRGDASDPMTLVPRDTTSAPTSSQHHADQGFQQSGDHNSSLPVSHSSARTTRTSSPSYDVSDLRSLMVKVPLPVPPDPVQDVRMERMGEQQQDLVLPPPSRTPSMGTHPSYMIGHPAPRGSVVGGVLPVGRQQSIARDVSFASRAPEPARLGPAHPQEGHWGVPPPPAVAYDPVPRRHDSYDHNHRSTRELEHHNAFSHHAGHQDSWVQNRDGHHRSVVSEAHGTFRSSDSSRPGSEMGLGHYDASRMSVAPAPRPLHAADSLLARQQRLQEMGMNGRDHLPHNFVDSRHVHASHPHHDHPHHAQHSSIHSGYAEPVTERSSSVYSDLNDTDLKDFLDHIGSSSDNEMASSPSRYRAVSSHNGRGRDQTYDGLHPNSIVRNTTHATYAATEYNGREVRPNGHSGGVGHHLTAATTDHVITEYQTKSMDFNGNCTTTDYRPAGTGTAHVQTWNHVDGHPSRVDSSAERRESYQEYNPGPKQGNDFQTNYKAPSPMHDGGRDPKNHRQDSSHAMNVSSDAFLEIVASDLQLADSELDDFFSSSSNGASDLHHVNANITGVL